MRTHIAILKRPYLNLILEGRKRLECRLTRISCPPFRQIDTGEKVLLKESAGPVRGEAIVRKVQFFDDLTPDKIDEIYQNYNQEILGGSDYWQGRRDCRYCSLIWLENVEECQPYRIQTKGWQAWLTS